MLKEEDFDEIIKRSMAEANPTYPVPVIFDNKKFEDVLKQLW